MSGLSKAILALSEFAQEMIKLTNRVASTEAAITEGLAKVKSDADYVTNANCRTIQHMNDRISKAEQATKDLVLAVAYAKVGNAMIQSSQMASGILMGRQYTADRLMSPKDRVHDIAYGAVNLHSHPNYESMPGLAEMAVVANGIPYRSRHNDYRITSTGQGGEPGTIAHQQIPSDIQGFNNKAEYLRDIFTHTPEHVRMDLSYVELWMKPVGDVSDEVDSFRHAELYTGLLENYQQATKLDALGDKDRLENISVGPIQLVGITDRGTPIYGQPAFRIRTKPIGFMGAYSKGGRPQILVLTGDSHDHQLESMSDDQYAALMAGQHIELTATGSRHTHVYTISYDTTAGVYEWIEQAGASHTHDLLIREPYHGRLPFQKDLCLAGIV